MNSSAKRRAVCGKVVSYKEESDEELEGDYEEAKNISIFITCALLSILLIHMK